MGLTRKRQRELNRLKGTASDVWDDQKDVLERANRVIREASRQAANYAREEVSPRVRETFEDRVRPAVNSASAAGAAAARSAATMTRERFNDDVLPAVSSVLGSALAVLDVAKDPKFRDALKRVSEVGETVSAKAGKVGKAAAKAGSKAGIVKAKPSPGPGRYILIGIGVVALIGVAYAAWQTLRADDDLWIDDDEVTESSGEIQPS
jgi:hypothetical protein